MDRKLEELERGNKENEILWIFVRILVLYSVGRE